MTAFQDYANEALVLTDADCEALWGNSEGVQSAQATDTSEVKVTPSKAEFSKRPRRTQGFTPRRAPTLDKQNQENARRQQLQAQAAALMAGKPEEALRSLAPKNTRAPVDRLEAIKTLGLYRKSVKMQPVISDYTPKKLVEPDIFPYHPGQTLTKLSRGVSREWVQLLVGVSSTSLQGGRLYGSQGRNLIRIIEELRKHAYLEINNDLSPRQVREQIVQVVYGEDFCFSKQCGLSRSTFYEALKHPLAHLFIRSQKVQRIEEGTEARRNCATLFSVALYEPLIPADLEAAYWSEPVEGEEIFLVPDYKSEVVLTKRRPLNNQKQSKIGDQLTAQLQGSSSGALHGKAREEFLSWIDSAALISRVDKAKTVDLADEELEGCIDRLRDLNPEYWQLAMQIAQHHDEPHTRAVAAIGYYKALIHLGLKKVRYWVRCIEKWRLSGQNIETPGKLLMYHLNRQARKLLHFNISDLGTEAGTMAP